MPANLTPQYQKAEREFRRAQALPEQIDCLQRMLQLIPKHKGTERLQASLKTRLREARLQLAAASNSSRGGQQFRLPRQGAGRIVVIGAANCGKSRLLSELTRATPEVSPWPFTTREPMPGMLICNDVQIQLIDTPPITSGHLEPWMLNLVRTADAALLLLNGSSDDSVQETRQVITELESRKTRLSTVSGFDENDFAVLRVPTQVVVTHAADPDSQLRLQMFQELCDTALPVVSLDFDVDRLSSISDRPPEHELASRDYLMQCTYQLLNIVRVFTRRPGHEPDLRDPIPLPVGATVEYLALHLHEELFARLTSARVWHHQSAESLTVGRQFVLTDADIVELH